MKDDLTIEKGIPIPPKRHTINKGWVATLRRMEVGDSVLFENRKQAGGAIQELKRNKDPRKFVTRTVDGGIRVWRFE